MGVPDVDAKLARAAAMLDRFDWSRLETGAKQEVAMPYGELARRLVLMLPETGATRNALETLDTAFRAALAAVPQ